MKITAKTTLTELAAIISDALESSNIIATLSGGAAVSIYSKNIYQSADLDFVTAAPVDVLKDALEPLGFRHSGNPRLSVFDHPETAWYVDCPPAQLGFGGTYVNPSSCSLIETTEPKKIDCSLYSFSRNVNCIFCINNQHSY